MKSFVCSLSTTYEMICQVPVDGDRYKLIRLNTICLESHPHSLITAPLLAPEVLFILFILGFFDSMRCHLYIHHTII